MGMAGCKKDNSGRYALIVNNATEESQICTQAVWDGLTAYALTNEAGCKRYTAQGNEREDFAEAIEEAVDQGAKVVVCVGEELEVPVYEAQKDFRQVRFILLNGEPHKRHSKKTVVEENTIALHFNETQQGYLAGYTAVMNGYRHIGCMGGVETEANLKIAAGFVRGAEDAGKALALAEGDILLHYAFTGADQLSPVYMSKALDWYKGGCEVIFALDEGIRLSVIEAARMQSGWILGTEQSALAESERVVTSAIIDYAGAVTNQIELIETDAFVGGAVVNCGVKEKGVSLILEDIGLSDNTIAQYNAICQKITEGTLQVEETQVIPATTVVTFIRE